MTDPVPPQFTFHTIEPRARDPAIPISDCWSLVVRWPGAWRRRQRKGSAGPPV